MGRMVDVSEQLRGAAVRAELLRQSVEYGRASPSAMRAKAMTPARRAEIEAWYAGLSGFDSRLTCCAAATDLLAELRRVEAVIRETHVLERCAAWAPYGKHAPECLLYEIEETP